MEPQMVRGSEEYESKRSLPAEKPEKKEKAKKKSFRHLVSKHTAEQAGAHDQIIVLMHAATSIR